MLSIPAVVRVRLATWVKGRGAVSLTVSKRNYFAFCNAQIRLILLSMKVVHLKLQSLEGNFHPLNHLANGELLSNDTPPGVLGIL